MVKDMLVALFSSPFLCSLLYPVYFMCLVWLKCLFSFCAYLHFLGVYYVKITNFNIIELLCMSVVEIDGKSVEKCSCFFASPDICAAL